MMANIEAKYHLNDPIMTQYFSYLKQPAHGDFGPSFKYKDYSVNDLGLHPLSLLLSNWEPQHFSCGNTGVSAGVIAALKQKHQMGLYRDGLLHDRGCYPQFCGCTIIIMIFCDHFALAAGRWLECGALKFMILPMVALSLAYIARCIARITCGSMIEVLHSNFIRTARAKGLPMRRIILRHALKPALVTRALL